MATPSRDTGHAAACLTAARCAVVTRIPTCRHVATPSRDTGHAAASLAAARCAVVTRIPSYTHT